MPRPVFIIGCPRSGTSVTLNIFARHEELAWVSDFLDSKPEKLIRTRRNRIYDLPVIGDKLYLAKTHAKNLPPRVKCRLPAPVEPWSFWSHYLEKFQWERGGKEPPRRTAAADISEQEIVRIKKVIDAVCKYQRKPRFVSKYTDFPRIAYLSTAFPDALFVHIIRDGRAVAASYLNKIESGKFGTWDEREWWVRGWPESYREEWRKYKQTPLSFVALQWKYFVGEIREEAKFTNKDQYLEVHYRDIIGDPYVAFKSIFDFCGLRRSRRVERYLDGIHLGNMNYKWSKRFSEEEQNLLTEITGEGDFGQLLDNEK